jgi:hypothetical protein
MLIVLALVFADDRTWRTFSIIFIRGAKSSAELLDAAFARSDARKAVAP